MCIIHTYVRTYVRSATHPRHTSTNIHSYIHTYIHTPVHTYIHTYTHTQLSELRALDIELRTLATQAQTFRTREQKALQTLEPLQTQLTQAHTTLSHLCTAAGRPLENVCACSHKKHAPFHNALIAIETAENGILTVISEFEELKELKARLSRDAATLREQQGMRDAQARYACMYVCVCVWVYVYIIIKYVCVCIYIYVCIYVCIM